MERRECVPDALLLFLFGGDFMLENQFKTNLVRELKERFPGCIVLHIDPNEIQGIPEDVYKRQV